MSLNDEKRATVDVDGAPTSYLTAGDGPVVLMLHGTYWSRVFLPILDDLAAAGLRPVAVDLPGFGRSGGELTVKTATIPDLSAWVMRFVRALGVEGPVSIVGHDIGGAIAQHLLADGAVNAFALVNGVTYDSWPQPRIARFSDPALVAATSARDLVELRRGAVVDALAGAATDALVEEYLEPLAEERVARSWMAFAAAADKRYTLDLMPSLRASTTPKLLVWGEDDPFQQVHYAERFAAEVSNTTLVRVANAGHIPTENDPRAVGAPLAEFFAKHAASKPNRG